MADVNIATSSELREIADLSDALVELFAKLSFIDFDEVKIGDSNGDPLGVLVYENGVFGFRQV